MYDVAGFCLLLQHAHAIARLFCDSAKGEVCQVVNTFSLLVGRIRVACCLHGLLQLLLKRQAYVTVTLKSV